MRAHGPQDRVKQHKVPRPYADAPDELRDLTERARQLTISDPHRHHVAKARDRLIPSLADLAASRETSELVRGAAQVAAGMLLIGQDVDRA